MRGFARKGYRAYFCNPRDAREPSSGVAEIEPNLLVAGSLTLLRELDGPDTVLWITYPLHVLLRQTFRRARVVYDIIDELEVFAGYCPRMARDHGRLLAAADLVVVTADRLRDAVHRSRPDAILVPNGVWPEEFRPPPVLPPPPEDLAEVVARGAPIVGYHGALAAWFDYELLDEVAARCPDLSFVLVGPDYDGSLQMLRTRANVWALGPKPYRDVARYVHRFDVAMIPFRLTRVTQATSPIKLFEYMAAEKPTVTTDLVECRKYRSALVARDGASFAERLRDALARGRDAGFVEMVRREAEANSWSQRIDTVLAALAGRPGAGVPAGGRQRERPR
jgi:hypothetical protein